MVGERVRIRNRLMVRKRVRVTGCHDKTGTTEPGMPELGLRLGLGLA